MVQVGKSRLGGVLLELNELKNRILLLEFQQKLLINMIRNKDSAFFEMVIEKKLTEEEMNGFFQLCEEMSIRIRKQKAEGLVYFLPLLEEFLQRIHPKLQGKDVIEACIQQKLFLPLMCEFKKYLN